jgi:hypothetical protein
MKLVDDIGARLKHFSTVALALGGGIQGAWVVFPEDLKSSLGPDVALWVARVTAIVLVWGLGGKFIAQPPKDAP